MEPIDLDALRRHAGPVLSAAAAENGPPVLVNAEKAGS